MCQHPTDTMRRKFPTHAPVAHVYLSIAVAFGLPYPVPAVVFVAEGVGLMLTGKVRLPRLRRPEIARRGQLLVAVRACPGQSEAWQARAFTSYFCGGGGAADI